MLLVTVLAPGSGDRWTEWRWITTDERALWATLAAVVVLGLWGAWVGWRRGHDESGPSPD